MKKSKDKKEKKIKLKVSRKKDVLRGMPPDQQEKFKGVKKLYPMIQLINRNGETTLSHDATHHVRLWVSRDMWFDVSVLKKERGIHLSALGPVIIRPNVTNDFDVIEDTKR